MFPTMLYVLCVCVCVCVELSPLWCCNSVGYLNPTQVFKVLGEDGNIYAIKEVYVKHALPEIKTAYVNEIKLLNKLQDKPGIITLHD